MKGIEVMRDVNVVVIPCDRFEELIRLETRVNLIVERLYHGSTFDAEDLLWMFDTDLSCETAQEMRDKKRKKFEENRCLEQRIVGDCD